MAGREEAAGRVLAWTSSASHLQLGVIWLGAWEVQLGITCPLYKVCICSVVSLPKIPSSGHLGKFLLQKCGETNGFFGFVSDTVFDHIVRKTLGHPGYLEALTLVSRNWEIYWTEHPGFVGSCFDAQLGPYSPKPKQKESIPLCFYFCCTEKLSFSWGIQLSTFRKELHLKLASE